MRKAYTFRSTSMMDRYMNAIMKDWSIYRTSVIKLSLYLFAIHSSKRVRIEQDLWSIVHELEQMAPPDFPDYATFAD